MKKQNRILLIFAIMLLVCCLTFTLVACGENGKDENNGQNGANVKSEFELYKESHPEFEGTEEDWLNGLTGSGIAPEAGVFAFGKNLDGASYTLVSYTGNDFRIDIPVSYAGFPITAIGDNAFKNNTTVKNVIIHDKITSIGENAFSKCSNLTTVIIGNAVKKIGENAFYDCGSLTSVTIPNSVTTIGDYAFYGCGLASVTIPNGITSIGDYTFGNCGNLTSITIPDSVTSIGIYSFYKSSIANLIIPDSVTNIDDHAFDSCGGLTSVIIGKGVKSISENVFTGCSSLTNITFGDALNWYTTYNFTDWQNRDGGTQIDVTNASNNATYFRDKYRYNYWYKL